MSANTKNDIIDDRPTQMCAEDEQLVAKIRDSKKGKIFDYLWGNPPPRGGYCKRDGDVALCSYMAFWAGHDKKRIDRIYRSSQRYTREWDAVATPDERTYGQGVIQKALARQEAFHWSAKQARTDVAPATSMSDVLASRVREEATTDAA